MRTKVIFDRGLVTELMLSSFKLLSQVYMHNLQTCTRERIHGQTSAHMCAHMCKACTLFCVASASLKALTRIPFQVNDLTFASKSAILARSRSFSASQSCLALSMWAQSFKF